MIETRVLLVDDEPLNLEILVDYFEGEEPFVVDTANGGEAAWQLLQDPGKNFRLILLDRMMPGLDGIGLLKRIKSDPRLSSIPVIMQTAASAAEQIREGLEAGAYYYLTKPYQPAALTAIVRVALADAADQAAAVRRSVEHAETLRLLEAADFHFATIDEANRLAGFLAALCPEADTAAMGLTELMINAIEHGNLEITYAEKSALKRTDGWEAEVARRLALPANRAKTARIAVRRTADEIVFTIRDEGRGFDWQRYLDFDPVRAFDPNGRGIAMAGRMSFSRIEYCGSGSEVVAAVAAVATPKL